MAFGKAEKPVSIIPKFEGDEKPIILEIKTTPLKAAMNVGIEILKLRQKIRDVISETDREIAKLESLKPEATQRLADAEAETALNGKPETSSHIGGPTPFALRDQIETLHLRRQGLEKKLLDTDNALLKADREFERQRSEDTELKLQSARGEYQKAALEFITSARKMYALMEALGIPNTLGDLQINDAINSDRPIARVRDFQWFGGMHIQVLPETPELRAVTERHRPITEMQISLNRESENVRRQRHDAQQAELSAKPRNSSTIMGGMPAEDLERERGNALFPKRDLSFHFPGQGNTEMPPAKDISGYVGQSTIAAEESVHASEERLAREEIAITLGVEHE